jgi:hypothetical protein
MTYWYRIGVIHNTVGSRCYGSVVDNFYIGVFVSNMHHCTGLFDNVISAFVANCSYIFIRYCWTVAIIVIWYKV